MSRSLALLGTAGLALLPLVAGSADVQHQEREHARQLQSLAEATAVTVSAALSQRLDQLQLMAATADIRHLARHPDAWWALVEQLRWMAPHCAWIAAADATGTVRAASGTLRAGDNVARQPWFTAAQLSAFASDVHENQRLQRVASLPGSAGSQAQLLDQALDLAVPLRDEHGRTVGVLAARIHPAWLASVVASVRPHRMGGVGAEVLLLDRSSRVIVATPHEQAARALAVTALPEDAAYQAARANVPSHDLAADLGWHVVARARRDAPSVYAAAPWALACVGVASALARWRRRREPRVAVAAPASEGVR